jgi:hypothetical protein
MAPNLPDRGDDAIAWTSDMDTTSAGSTIAVDVSEDRQTAFVTVRGGGSEAGELELRRALEAANVRAGIDEQAVARLAAALGDPSAGVVREIVASGSAVRPGEDGRFEPSLPTGIQPGRLRDDGTMDFHDRELLQRVGQGQTIGALRRARAGVAGWLVDGTVLAPEAVREQSLTLGPGAVLDDDGTVRALRAGVVVCTQAGKIDVVDRHVQQGPVDFHSGNLAMVGSVVVSGDVRAGFRVQATGDVEIHGSVENASVFAGGSVHVRQGVHGGDGGVVCAEGDLWVHHAEAATLLAGGVLEVGDAVHSELSASRIVVSRRVRGGLARAELSVVAGEVGSPQSAETSLTAGEPFELPLLTAQRELERSKAMRAVRTRAGGSTSRPGERARGGKAGRAQAELQAAEVQRLAQRARRRQELARSAFIQVAKAHPGVTLCIGRRTLLLEHELGAARITFDSQTRELRVDRLGP